MDGRGSGHIQSLVIGGALLVLGVITIMLGALADLIGRNRQLLEQTLERVRMLEEKVGEERGASRETRVPALPQRKRSATR
jgi:UPF0716 family protein affecting phage T7 exclusion